MVVVMAAGSTTTRASMAATQPLLSIRKDPRSTRTRNRLGISSSSQLGTTSVQAYSLGGQEPHLPGILGVPWCHLDKCLLKEVQGGAEEAHITAPQVDLAIVNRLQ